MEFIVANLERTNEYQISAYEAHDEYQVFSTNNPAGVRLVATPYDESNRLSLTSHAGDFRKWLQQEKPLINVELQKPAILVDHHSVDIWRGLFYIGRDLVLPVFLGLISAYLYDKMRGALRGDRSHVHLTVIYTDHKDGVCKKLVFDGDADAFAKLIERLRRG